MSTGFIWIAAIIILGGVIATVGDRIGTKVGKARLSLFKLRPRNTATLITILTGMVISFSTLGVLLAFDKRLRDGIFEIGRVQRLLELRRQDLTETRQQLETTTKAKTQVEQELTQAREEQKAQQIEAQRQQAAAQKRLKEINQSLRAALTKQIQTQAQLNRTRGQLERVSAQYRQAQAQLNTVTGQARRLRQEIQQNQKELQALVAQRNQLKKRISQQDREIAKLDAEIQRRDLSIAQREALLKDLEKEAIALARNLQLLRQGNLALVRGQVLAARVVRIVRPSAARQAIEEILREANRNAMNQTQPGVEKISQRVVKISEKQVEQLIEQIDDGRDYFVRILAANNYVVGESSVQVFADVALNQQVFKPGEVLSRIEANPAVMTTREVRQRIDLLLEAAKFSAQRAGVLDENLLIADNRIQTLIRFFEQLQSYDRPLELKAIAAQNIYTAGPIAVELLAIQNGQVIFSTQQSLPQPTEQEAGSREQEAGSRGAEEQEAGSREQGAEEQEAESGE
ncbi:hypothetical protein B7486_34695 [cyanobacterium TDX16]|nr:hypothetical protein B7486_34695 [cyanobacterium TDX16]